MKWKKTDFLLKNETQKIMHFNVDDNDDKFEF